MKFGIKQTGFNEVLLVSESITDKMRNYLKVNPTSYLVKKTKKGWISVDIG